MKLVSKQGYILPISEPSDDCSEHEICEVFSEIVINGYTLLLDCQRVH